MLRPTVMTEPKGRAMIPRCRGWQSSPLKKYIA